MTRSISSAAVFTLIALLLTLNPANAAAQTGIECMQHLSPCHVDTRLEMAGIESPAAARAFITRLKAAASRGDRLGLAKLVKYPLTIREGDRVKTYRSAAEVVRAFDAIFTRGVLIAIAAAEYESLFVNDSGAMIGDGEIWFDGWSGAVLIKAVSPAEATSTGVSGGMERIFRTQQALNSLGYDAGAADGRMGPRTRKALAAFQRAQGIQVTSEIDAKTIAALTTAREQGRAPQAAEEVGASPEGIVREIYATLGLAPAEERQLMEVMTTPKQRARYFAPPLVALFDANDSDECIDFSLNVNGQDYDSNEIARTLKIEKTVDGDRTIVDAIFTSFGNQNHFRYEFIRDGEDWKISDIASLESFAWRLSDLSCGPADREAPHSAQPSETPQRRSMIKPETGSQPGFKDCEICPEMVVLPAGSYLMGATDEDKAFPNTEYTIPTELPLHKVTLDYSFAIGRFTITVAEFAAFVEETGTAIGGECLLRVPDKGPNKGKFIGKISANADEFQRGKHGVVVVEYADFRAPGTNVTENQPATCISRNEAKAYLAWLSEKTDRAYRFPTEAEWEYATRAGETRPYYFGAGNGDQEKVCTYGNFADRKSVYGPGDFAKCAEQNSREYTYPVGSFKPNNWGLYDMIGNVFEYVEDCYFPDYEGAPNDGSPWLHSTTHGYHSTEKPGACKVWALRGYFFDSLDMSMRSAMRCGVYNDENSRGNALGLRVAVSMSGEPWDRRQGG